VYWTHICVCWQRDPAQASALICRIDSARLFIYYLGSLKLVSRKKRTGSQSHEQGAQQCLCHETKRRVNKSLCRQGTSCPVYLVRCWEVWRVMQVLTWGQPAQLRKKAAILSGQRSNIIEDRSRLDRSKIQGHGLSLHKSYPLLTSTRTRFGSRRAR
jgi:hypothetical protein